ncbi:hypothetical protein RB195_008444 [Necator americanus]|uniref:Uncharacterized protein n=1 Tax=Necator americanus TaxID=51031 RepID=A0ABR1CNP9_NECAM
MVPIRLSRDSTEKSSATLSGLFRERTMNLLTQFTDTSDPEIQLKGREISHVVPEELMETNERRNSNGSGTVMKTSYSTPQLQTPTVAEKFLFPKGDEQKMRKYSVEQKSDSGIVKDTLTQKDSWLSVDGYFTPRETIKRKKEIPQPCHDSVSTERLYMDRPRRSGGGGGGAANAGIRSRITSSKAILTEKDWKEYDLDYLDVAKLQLKRMSEDMKSEF